MNKEEINALISKYKSFLENNTRQETLIFISKLSEDEAKVLLVDIVWDYFLAKI